jgi:hypothetical protein
MDMSSLDLPLNFNRKVGLHATVRYSLLVGMFVGLIDVGKGVPEHLKPPQKLVPLRLSVFPLRFVFL